jgi:hypothetical protein
MIKENGARQCRRASHKQDGFETAEAGFWFLQHRASNLPDAELGLGVPREISTS